MVQNMMKRNNYCVNKKHGVVSYVIVAFGYVVWLSICVKKGISTQHWPPVYTYREM